jgi:hypothetical protein
MSLRIGPSKRRKVIIGVSAFALVTLVVIGVFASNGWFPKTDPLSGKKTGWFGRPVSEPGAVATGFNPNAPMPSGTPQLSREYIYAAGSRLLAVEDANANAAKRVHPASVALTR